MTPLPTKAEYRGYSRPPSRSGGVGGRGLDSLCSFLSRPSKNFVKSLSGSVENLAQRQAPSQGAENRLRVARLGPQLSFGVAAQKR